MAQSLSPAPNLSAAPQSLARWFASAFPDSPAVQGEPPLELSNPDPPRLTHAKVIEGESMRARVVDGQPVATFAAFLDGRQMSATMCYRAGIPIIKAAVGAVIRERKDQRLHTWKHAVARALYASRSHLGDPDWRTLQSAPERVVDTHEKSADAIEHPLALRDAAILCIQQDREKLEQQLAAEWCASERRPLLVDGGISHPPSVATSPFAVGVVKSHRTFYARGEALAVALALKLAERSSVFLVESAKRTSVASWYLRLRDSGGHDPMWGLVRVEVAAPARDITVRADEVSRWILAEAHPVALPDGRWDKMVYGVRDCEEFLSAVMGNV